jgi:hypothetical protein
MEEIALTLCVVLAAIAMVLELVWIYRCSNN